VEAGIFDAIAYGVDFTGDATKAAANSAALDRCTADAAVANGVVYLRPGTVVLARPWVFHNAYTTVQGSGGSASHGGHVPVGDFLGAGTILKSPQDDTSNWPLMAWYTDKQYTSDPKGVYASMRDLVIEGYNPGAPNYEPHIIFEINPRTNAPPGLSNDGTTTTVSYTSPGGFQLFTGQYAYIIAGTPDSPYNGYWGPITAVSKNQFTYQDHRVVPLPVGGGGVILLGPKLLKDINGNYTNTPYLCTILRLQNKNNETTVTVDYTGSNGLYGGYVTIVGAAEPAYNGTFGPIKVVDSSHFTYHQTSVAGLSDSGGGFVCRAGGAEVGPNQHGVVVDNTALNMSNVTIAGCMGHGLFLRDCLGGNFENINIYASAGSNIWLDGRPYPHDQWRGTGEITAKDDEGGPGLSNNGRVTTVRMYNNNFALASGMFVQISGAKVADYNGDYLGPVTVLGKNAKTGRYEFVYSQVEGVALPDDGGGFVNPPFEFTGGPNITTATAMVPGLSNDGSTTAVNTARPHGLFTGLFVMVSGAANGAYNALSTKASALIAAGSQTVKAENSKLLFAVGNRLIIDRGIMGREETVTVTAGGTGEFTAVFANSHDINATVTCASLLAGPITVTSSTQFTFPQSGPIPDSGDGIILPDFVDPHARIRRAYPNANSFRGINGGSCAGTAICFVSACSYNNFYNVDQEAAAGYAVDFGGGSYESTLPSNFNNFFGIHEELCGASFRFQDDKGGTTKGTGAKGNFLWLSNSDDFDPNGFRDGTIDPGGIQNNVIGATNITGLQESGNFSVLPRWGSTALIRSALSHPQQPLTPEKLDFAVYSGIVDVTLTKDITYEFVAAENGQLVHLILRQGNGGGHKVTWPTIVVWRNGVPPTLRSPPNAYDYFVFYYSKDDQKFYELSSETDYGSFPAGIQPGTLHVELTDGSGAPGDITIDKIAGKAAIAAGASSVTVRNAIVGPKSLVFITPGNLDSTLNTWKVVVANGQFAVTGNAAATGNWPFSFFVLSSAT
jgi:hypothetical protein